MKHLNRLVLALVGILLFITFAHAEPAGDLSTQNRASFVARGNNDLTLGNQGTGSLKIRQNGATTMTLAGSSGVTSLGSYLSIDNATGVVTVGGNTTFTPSCSVMTIEASPLVMQSATDLVIKALTGQMLFNVSAGDALLITSAGALALGLTSQKIIGATTATYFRDHADTDNNIQIDDGGLVTISRGNVSFPTDGTQPVFPAAVVITPAVAVPTPAAGNTMSGRYTILAAGAPTAAYVVLPIATASIGKKFTIFNQGSNPLAIVPQTGVINVSAALTPFSCTTLKECECTGLTSGVFGCSQK